FMRIKSIIFAILIAFSQTGFAGEKEKNLENKIRAMLESEALKTASLAFYAAYADTGEIIADINSQKSLVPASLMKLFVSAAALEKLGPDYTFETRLYSDGEVRNGALAGNLYIRGGGDPSFGSTLVKGALSYEEIFSKWISTLKEKNINEIYGNVFADGNLFEGAAVPGSWAWEDPGNYYGAPVDGLSINDNLYKLCLKSDKQEGSYTEVVRTEPDNLGISFENFIKVGPPGSGDVGYIFNFPGNYRATLRGTVPPGYKEFCIKGALPEPALAAAQMFAQALKSGRPEKLKEPVSYDDKELIAAHKSPPISDIVHAMNKRSFNFYAETFLRHIGIAYGQGGTLAGGLAGLKTFVSSAGISTDGLRFADGCGLSYVNFTTAKTLAELLIYMSKSGSFKNYYESLPTPGNDPETIGHIQKFGANVPSLKDNVHIKSGTLKTVRSYAGYMRGKNERLMVFVFMGNNFSASANDVAALNEKILSLISEEEI
ncbi:MAG: D-alanyl-D-alanine carboxypeptidase/D-alanyl-D-alanine-endopeptidase, partial [Elusimicrobia bacterium]|nr:D-alanyl-D-alanine carboxypeptidase/D-alanyl-D-alanine-endopeptidase [Elusimicrobiota bacterium]